MYSSASAQPNLLPAFSSSEDQRPTTASFNTQAGVKLAHANSKSHSASDGAVKKHSKPLEGSYADKVSLTCPSRISGSNTQNIQPNQSHHDDSAIHTRPPGIPNNALPPETFENIIAHLQTIFPGYSRYFLMCTMLWWAIKILIVP